MTRGRAGRSPGHYKQVVEPIKENDILKLRKMLKDNSNFLTEYVENLCLFRMSVFGYIDEDNSHSQKIHEIIDRFDQNKDAREKVKLPNEFETARNILLRMKEEYHFNRVLKEVRSIVQ